jgi:hypothetical protein
VRTLRTERHAANCSTMLLVATTALENEFGRSPDNSRCMAEMPVAPATSANAKPRQRGAVAIHGPYRTRRRKFERPFSFCGRPRRGWHAFAGLSCRDLLGHYSGPRPMPADDIASGQRRNTWENVNEATSTFRFYGVYTGGCSPSTRRATLGLIKSGC